MQHLTSSIPPASSHSRLKPTAFENGNLAEDRINGQVHYSWFVLSGNVILLYVIFYIIVDMNFTIITCLMSTSSSGLYTA